jgi:hypothetical protein
MLSPFWSGFHDVSDSIPVVCRHFAVTQIASETKSLALDVIAPPTR